jgi:hypothetical protein
MGGRRIIKIYFLYALYIHADYGSALSGVGVPASPATTATQADLDHAGPDLRWDPRQLPGCRIIELWDDGRTTSRVLRAELPPAAGYSASL